MHDPSNALNDDPGDRPPLASVDAATLAPQPEPGKHRAELYARLRNIIDNATESIRALKEENAALSARNAEMTDRIGVLERRIRAVTTDLADDERELRKSAEALEHAMRGTTPAPAASASDAIESPATPGSEAEREPEIEPEAAMSEREDTAPIPQPEPTAPPAPIADESEERVIAPRPASKDDATYTLVASPFVRFSDLGQFQAALQKLTGVHDVQVRRFAQGTLEMRIGYSGPTDLATTLRTLAAEIEDVREEEPYQLRVRLRTSQDA